MASERPMPKTVGKRKTDPNKENLLGNHLTGERYQKEFLSHALGYSAWTEQ